MRLMVKGLVSVAAFAAFAPMAKGITEIDVGDAAFTAAEINVSMVAYSTSNGMHTSIDNITTRYQSFVPTATSLIGVAFSTTASPNGLIVPQNTPQSMVFKLFEGEGVAGAILAEKTVAGAWQDPAAGNVIWTYCRFVSPVAVTAGAKYTFSVGVVDATLPRIQWAVRTDNPYAGGRSDSNASWDHTFKVAAVPEPTSLAVLGLGLLPLLKRRK